MYITVKLFIEKKKKKKKGLYYCIILARYHFKITNAKFDIHILSI